LNSDKSGTLVVLACHGVFDPQLDNVYSEHSEDRHVYEAHMGYALQHLMWRAESSPFLVISGGYTKIERQCSESRSYLELASIRQISVPQNVGLEEFALTSIENILLSLYVYHGIRGVWPEHVEAISWEFKRQRFERTLEAINNWPALGQTWPPLRFFPVGDLFGGARAGSLKVEQGYIDTLTEGIDNYYASSETKEVLARRDVFESRGLARKRYANYPLPF
jgi:hypothetical protein